MILHIPHSSKAIPEKARSRFLVSDDDIEKELCVMTDHYTDDLFDSDSPEVLSIIHPLSRLVVDPERFIDDSKECMSQKGMGVIYTRTSSGMILRSPLSAEEKNDLLDRYYHPHHEKVMTAVNRELERKGYSLMLDCHSFSSIPLPHEMDQSPNRPDICIGTDDFHTPGWLADTLEDVFRAAGFAVDINRPFSGTFVPSSYYRLEPEVLSAMIELNRKLYMDEKTGCKDESYPSIKSRLTRCIEKIQSRADAKLKR
jgi:N-formylglutamate deformylase